MIAVSALVKSNGNVKILVSDGHALHMGTVAQLMGLAVISTEVVATTMSVSTNAKLFTRTEHESDIAFLADRKTSTLVSHD